MSQDPRFAEKVKDVVGLYLDPPDNAVVVSMNEKTRVPALDRTQPTLPLRPGQIEGGTYESPTGADFLAFLDKLAATFRRGQLHVILDSSSTFSTPEVQEWLAADPRVVFHFTPTRASWLDRVEGFFTVLTRRSLKRDSPGSREPQGAARDTPAPRHPPGFPG